MKSLLIIFFSFIINCLWAQGIINNNSTISITDGTTLFINTDFTNNGTVINNGSMFISGAWTNNNTYEEGSGTFVLSSTNDQVVNHNAQSFTNLRIVGGGVKYFLADLTITESLTLDDGILFSQNGSQLIVNQNAEIVGGSASSYINGTLSRTGTGELFFPIGSNTEYLPVSLEQIEGNNPTIRATAFSDSGIFNTDQRFSTIDQNRYWQLSFQNYEGSYIELPLFGNNNFTDIEKLVVIATDEANGDIENLGVFDNSGTLNNGSVASDQLALQQFYTLAQLPEEEISGTNINVFNVITPNGDGKHDFLNIENISAYPNNTVTIYNKWGNKLWQISAYNNQDKVFIGVADNGNELLTGNYHYVIDKGNGDKPLKGFLFIQR